MKETPNYYAIIPATVRYDKTLPPNVRLLYGELTALSNKEGFCWSGNKYFAELYGVHKNTVSSWIAKLSKKKYIRLEFEELEDGSIKRKIFINHLPPLTKSFTPLNKKVNTPKQKAEHNTTSNNTDNNTDNIFLEKNQNLSNNAKTPQPTPKTQTPQEKEKSCAKKEKEEVVDEGLVVLEKSEKLKQTIQTYLSSNPSILPLIRGKARYRGDIGEELVKWCDYHCDNHKTRTPKTATSHFTKTFPTWLINAKSRGRGRTKPTTHQPSPHSTFEGMGSRTDIRF